MCLVVGFCIVEFCRILLPWGLFLSGATGGIVWGNGCLHLDFGLWGRWSSSWLDVWELWLESGPCISVLRLPIFGTVLGSASCLGGLLPGNCCCVVGDTPGVFFARIFQNSTAENSKLNNFSPQNSTQIFIKLNFPANFQKSFAGNFEGQYW